MERNKISSPSSIGQRIALAEQAIAQTKSRKHKGKPSAIPYYLQATETLWPVVRDHPHPANTPVKSPVNHQGQLTLAHQLYAHAAAHATARVINHYPIHDKQQSLTIEGQTIHIHCENKQSIHPSFFDRIDPSDTYRYGNLGGTHYRTKGLGAAAVGYRQQAPTNHPTALTPSLDGMSLPINIIIDYPQDGKPRLTITNLLKTIHTRITGSPRQLETDFSAPIAATAATQSITAGIAFALSPDKHGKEAGLYSLSPYDPDKIPLIFVHGLISQPVTWTRASNFLMGDPILRQTYQFYYYYYPTGQTPIISGAQLRQTLIKFYQDHPDNPNMQRTVLVGHSMGGLLSSIQSRTFNQKLWGQLFVNAPQERGPNSIYPHVSILFEHPTLHQIERTVFIATPHRGSSLANNWVGRLGAAFVKLPQSVNSLQIHTITDNMTHLGRSIFPSKGSPNSITQLKANTPSLQILNQQPFNKRVQYHSIIGDRGRRGDPKQSSDGVVAYWSSHIEGASSEKIIPANHETHLHPEAHRELARILHLHAAAEKN